MKKLTDWIKSTGLTNVAYVLFFILAWVYGLKMLAGAFIGVFLYVNWNTIRKLVSGDSNESDETAESIPGGGIKKPDTDKNASIPGGGVKKPKT